MRLYLKRFFWPHLREPETGAQQCFWFEKLFVGFGWGNKPD